MSDFYIKEFKLFLNITEDINKENKKKRTIFFFLKL